MSDFLKTLQERRASAWERAKGVMDAAAAEARDLTAEENETLRAIDVDLDGLDARIKETQARFAAAEAADAIREKAHPVLKAAGIPETDTGIIRSVFRGEARDSYPTMEARALVTSTDSVAQSFYDRVVVYSRTLNPVYEVATVIRTSNGENITIPRLTADQATYTPGEGTAITPADPTISSVTLGAFGYKSLTYWSAELEQDNAINLDDLVARSAARDIGLTAGSAFTLGGGSTAPNGIITAASNGGTAAGTPFFLADDLIALFYALAAPDRVNGSWMVATTAAKKMRQFKDTAGQYLYAVNVGSPDTFMGRPVYENPHMAAVASATKSVAFGDFSRYYLREVVPMRVAKSADFKFDTDQIAIRTVWRVDGDLIDTAAVKYLVSANT